MSTARPHRITPTGTLLRAPVHLYDGNKCSERHTFEESPISKILNKRPASCGQLHIKVPFKQSGYSDTRTYCISQNRFAQAPGARLEPQCSDLSFPYIWRTQRMYTRSPAYNNRSAADSSPSTFVRPWNSFLRDFFQPSLTHFLQTSNPFNLPRLFSFWLAILLVGASAGCEQQAPVTWRCMLHFNTWVARHLGSVIEVGALPSHCIPALTTCVHFLKVLHFHCRL